jgi:hypothetical protein
MPGLILRKTKDRVCHQDTKNEARLKESDHHSLA